MPTCKEAQNLLLDPIQPGLSLGKSAAEPQFSTSSSPLRIISSACCPAAACRIAPLVAKMIVELRPKRTLDYRI
jgi:hypothetical protein